MRPPPDDDPRGRPTVPETASVRELLEEQAAADPRPVLVVLTGAQVGERVALDGPAEVGRDPEAALTLTDDQIAWRHLRVVPEAERWVAVDLTEGQSTFDGASFERRPLEPDDQLSLGRVVVRFEVHDSVEQVYDRQVQQRIFTDELTGLPSRRRFDNDLRSMLAAAKRTERPLAVAILDIDRLKPINDAHGHLVGSAVIAHVGAVLAEVLPRTIMHCRLGGDEFALACLGMDAARLAQVADEVRARLAERPFAHGEQALQILLSGGVAAYPHAGQQPVELLRAADEALYRAKGGGGDRVLHV